MYLKIDDLKNNIYSYQVEQITEGDETIVLQALATAEEEVRSYFVFNDKVEYLDGRPRYDVDKIFSATDDQRHALLVSICLAVAKWYIVDLCNADIIYEHAKERYDRAIDLLKNIAKGNNTLSLPTLDENDEKNTLKIAQNPFSFGSRKKFNHE